MKKYLCVHGHFYQPPRENPWSGLIDEQKSAAPSHDWNERITLECYAPNARTQILNNHFQAIQTVNNYSQMSFNIGPTLLSWMERASPDTYRSILEADQKSITRFSGHGAAIAQAYNHMIMPLANNRDQQTQVIWGIKDFEFRFKRKPEGMWLPETAVDISTLEVLAEHDITFTILAPNQAQSVAKIGSDEWIDVSDGSIDTQMPYLCRLPSGKEIVIFFYNGHISNEVAFGNLLENGVNLANRLIQEYPKPLKRSRLVHIANDGETYGHHHAFGNMALAYMLYYIETNNLAKVTIYSEFLEKYPPEYEAKIIEDTSWSCFHGVERWKANCGCHLDLKKGWNQEWRKCLRETLDWLRDNLISFYEKSMSVYYDDPWKIRNEYVSLVLDPSNEELSDILWASAHRKLSGQEKKSIKNLLEMQRYAMLMYTSCGWFFDDISGLESTQILAYAARAIQLAHESGSINWEEEFINRLTSAKSNDKKMIDGKNIYNLRVKPAMLPTVEKK